MEFIGFIIVLVVVNLVWRAVVSAGKAGIDTASKGGNFGEHWHRNAFGMGPFELRTREIPPSADASFSVIEIEAKGIIPVQRRTMLGFTVSLFDFTEDDPQVILSKVDDFAEPNSVVYQFAMQPMSIDPDQGFGDWARVGVVIPDLLVPPRQGRRKIVVIVRLIDAAQSPSIELGFAAPGTPGILGSYEKQFEWTFDERGYSESREVTLKQKPLFVRLAVAVAMADGSFDVSEGKTISEWIERQLPMFSDKDAAELKASCNDALRDSYSAAKSGELSLSSVCDNILSITEPSERYEAIELALDVMAADGVAAPEELETIRRISSVLELDFDELQRMKDERLVSIKARISDNTEADSLETALGIDPEWSQEETLTFLTSEFKKWNARLNNLTDSEERENVQSRIELISQARKKYA